MSPVLLKTCLIASAGTVMKYFGVKRAQAYPSIPTNGLIPRWAARFPDNCANYTIAFASKAMSNPSL